MTPRFGTDGIRGPVGTVVTTEIVRALGAAAVRGLGADAPFLIARDTRASGPELEAALVEGITRAGGDACTLGVLPTPGLAGACVEAGAAGAMISASHNPFSDNGVKLFEPGGRKLRDETEAAVESGLHALLAGDARLDAPAGSGRAIEVADAVDGYVARLVTAAGGGTPLAGLAVVLDCAHGAAAE